MYRVDYFIRLLLRQDHHRARQYRLVFLQKWNLGARRHASVINRLDWNMHRFPLLADTATKVRVMVSFDGANRWRAEGNRNRDGLSKHIKVHISRAAREIFLLQHVSCWQLCAFQICRPQSELHLLDSLLHASHFYLDHRGAVYMLGETNEA